MSDWNSPPMAKLPLWQCPTAPHTAQQPHTALDSRTAWDWLESMTFSWAHNSPPPWRGNGRLSPWPIPSDTSCHQPGWRESFSPGCAEVHGVAVMSIPPPLCSGLWANSCSQTSCQLRWVLPRTKGNGAATFTGWSHPLNTMWAIF